MTGELLCLGCARPRRAPRRPLFEDHAALFVDLEPGGSKLISPNAQSAGRCRAPSPRPRGVVGRHGQLGRPFRRTMCRGIDVGAEGHAHLLDVVDDRGLGKALGPIECHVLDEVRQAPLVVVFEDRSGIDNEPQLGAVRRLARSRGRSSAGRWAASQRARRDRPASAARAHTTPQRQRTYRGGRTASARLMRPQLRRGEPAPGRTRFEIAIESSVYRIRRSTGVPTASIWDDAS